MEKIPVPNSRSPSHNGITIITAVGEEMPLPDSRKPSYDGKNIKYHVKEIMQLNSTRLSHGGVTHGVKSIT